MATDYGLDKWREAQTLVGLAAHEAADKVSKEVSIALAYEVIDKHPYPEVPYQEQIAIYKRKVDLVLEQRKKTVEDARFHADLERDAHVFKDLEPADPDDEHGGPRYR